MEPQLQLQHSKYEMCLIGFTKKLDFQSNFPQRQLTNVIKTRVSEFNKLNNICFEVKTLWAMNDLS